MITQHWIKPGRVSSLIFFALWITLVTIDTQAGEAYQLKPGDSLHVSVWGEEKLNRKTLVLPDGSISFPLTGSVLVSGLSVPEVESRLANKLEQYVPSPTVSIIVEATEGNRIYVLGHVKSPGTYIMSTPLSVVQALSLAGGLDTFADENDIRILRYSDKGQEQIEVFYSDILSGKNLSSNHALQAGDTILVP
ncbi:polysaccharide biosynthesis/export family protein [Microbulbifer sp. ALW1]|uniref:polysaccharide biosynthesis/export family protein n=1 Tax=Microbulbifer sp. (strain ALW1) TaxID=1516059 RepID=UPI00135939E2|nr:polysaccharide biosynthesis/export family protein [Microbulbifer sp. ALW1]